MFYCCSKPCRNSNCTYFLDFDLSNSIVVTNPFTSPHLTSLHHLTTCTFKVIQYPWTFQLKSSRSLFKYLQRRLTLFYTHTHTHTSRTHTYTRYTLITPFCFSFSFFSIFVLLLFFFFFFFKIRVV